MRVLDNFKMLTFIILALHIGFTVEVDYTECDTGDHDYYYFFYATEGGIAEDEVTPDEYCSGDLLDLLSCALFKFAEPAASETDSESEPCALDCGLADEFVTYINGKGDDMALCLLGFEQGRYGYSLESLLTGMLDQMLGSVICTAEEFGSLCPVGDGYWYHNLILATNSVYEWGEYGACEPCNEGDPGGTQTRSQICSTPLNGGLNCAAQDLTPAADESQACSCPGSGNDGNDDGNDDGNNDGNNDNNNNDGNSDGNNDNNNNDGNNDNSNNGNNDNNDGNNDATTAGEDTTGGDEEENGDSSAQTARITAGLLLLALLLTGW